ncbi:MAG: anthranilate synthase component I family protein [Methanoregulaceae archaeon]|nr:anthranilate synthase component I family protein [Methanoregulaceae archaeon]
MCTTEGTVSPSTGGSRGFLLESLDRDIRAESYSFLGISPILHISIGTATRITGDPRLVSLFRNVSGTDAIEIMKAISGVFNYIPSMVPRFSGGFAGYFSYDLVHSLIPGIGASRHQPDTGTTVAEFMLCTECIVFDHRNDTLSLICNAIITGEIDPVDEYERINSALALQIEVIKRLLDGGPFTLPGSRADTADSPGVYEFPVDTKTLNVKEITVLPTQHEGNSTTARQPVITLSGQGRNEFIRSVKLVKNYIRKGEIVQAVISRKEVFPFTGDPFALYRALRIVNPSPYMYFLDFPGHAVVGASPEMLVRVEGKNLTTVPIAGTRKRGHTPDEDTTLALDLLHDEKERAEHVMLVDLARNDVGSVSRFGSVKVPRFMEIGKYSHVQHIVSTVTGEIRPESDRFDGFKACFPAGTVTGAPKIRAMQIIDELEPEQRGLYAGAVGYIGFDNQLEFAIAIRTADVKDGIASVQAGAGIVADSCPSKEWTEANDKAEAMRSAIRFAGGLA